MLSFDYLPQKGVMTSDQFIPPADEIPEFWMTKVLPFNFPGIPTWGNAQLAINVQKRFLLTAVNLFYYSSFPIPYTVEAVTVDTPGVGMMPGRYPLYAVGGGGSGFGATVLVSDDATVHVDGVQIYSGGYGYTAAPTFTIGPRIVDGIPFNAGGAPAATFTAVITMNGLGPWTGEPSIQIYQNHRKVQLQLLQKSLFAPNIFGSGANPGYLKTPYLFDANDQITVECSYTSVFPNYEGASNTDPNYLYCFLTMIGGEPLG